MTSAVPALLERHVASGLIPGAIALVARPGRDAELCVVGSAAVGGPPLRPDAIVRIQSMTKAVVAVAALRLVEAGRLSLDTSIEQWLPELADRRVLTSPTAPLRDTVRAATPITLRHLLTNTSGYGGIVEDSPLARAMVDNGTDAGPEPVALGTDEWLARMAELPLAFPPGTGWRYHHSFGILGILLTRLSGRFIGDHLREDLLLPLGMVDTGYSVPLEDVDRLPAAYRYSDGGLVETESRAGGFYAGPPPFDVSHGEMVSTAADYFRFLRMLATGGESGGTRYLSAEHVALMTSDQTPERAKTPESFFPGFWNDTGWGFGVGVQTAGPRAGRFGWSGGQGTDFFVDPDGTIGILLTQVELGGPMMGVLSEFASVRDGD